MFVERPDPQQLTPAARRLHESDLADRGYVMDLTWLWSHLPEGKQGLFDLLALIAGAGGLTERQRAILVTATASTLGDSYCAYGWGGKLAGEVGEAAAAGVLSGDDGALDAEADRALAGWARKVAGSPTSTTADDVQALRDAGFDDRTILAATAWGALRLAFSSVNAALGAQPDAGLVASTPPAVQGAITYGRPPLT